MSESINFPDYMIKQIYVYKNYFIDNLSAISFP